MKFTLQKYDFKPGLLMWISMTLILTGAIVYYTLSASGIMFVLMGLAGLCWCFLPKL